MTKTPYGFEDVSMQEKTDKIHTLFQRVAPYYDLMNDLMSLGLHRCWKRRFFKLIQPAFQETILDVCGGTGDIAIGLKKFYPYLDLNIQVLDLSLSMMEKGVKRAADQGIVQGSSNGSSKASSAGLDWICGNAETLPLPDNSIDIYTVVFGLRNVGDLRLAIQEAFRVLKAGGRFFCLEFSPVQAPLIEKTFLKKAYDFYSFQVLPALGSFTANDADAYRYLAESIRRFPSPSLFVALLEEEGFYGVEWAHWSGGIVALHSAQKP